MPRPRRDGSPAVSPRKHKLNDLFVRRLKPSRAPFWSGTRRCGPSRSACSHRGQELEVHLPLPRQTALASYWRCRCDWPRRRPQTCKPHHLSSCRGQGPSRRAQGPTRRGDVRGTGSALLRRTRQAQEPLLEASRRTRPQASTTAMGGAARGRYQRSTVAVDINRIFYP